jgi:hypothetical protein
VFYNHQPEDLEPELAYAADLGVMPLRVGDPEFARAVAVADRMKWAVLEDEQVVFMDKHHAGVEIAHTVLTAGAPVLAAGEAEIVAFKGQYLWLDIDNHSGHYQPDSTSIAVGIAAFTAVGIRSAQEAFSLSEN